MSSSASARARARLVGNPGGFLAAIGSRDRTGQHLALPRRLLLNGGSAFLIHLVAPGIRRHSDALAHSRDRTQVPGFTAPWALRKIIGGGGLNRSSRPS